MSAERGEPGPFRATMQVRSFGPTTIARIEAETHQMSRNQTHIAAASEASYFLRLQIQGTACFQQAGRETILAPGDLTIFDSVVPFSADLAGDYESIGLKIPRQMLAWRLAAPDSIGAIHLNGRSDLGGLAASHLGMMLNGRDDLGMPAQTAVLSNLCGLLAISIGASPDGRDDGRITLAESRLQAIVHHIGEHFADGEMKPAAVAAQFGISERYLNKLLERTGQTFSAALLSRRLEASRAALNDPAMDRLAISDIAFRAGFNDLSHFNRRFRAAYGMSPKELRAARRQ
jgi:AraC family transcriptional activator of tynA and feaB